MNIAADHLEEITNIAISRRQREAWELPAEVRARFADHALSVNRPDVAAEFMSATPVERAA